MGGWLHMNEGGGPKATTEVQKKYPYTTKQQEQTLDTLQRGVQSEGGAVDGGSII